MDKIKNKLNLKSGDFIETKTLKNKLQIIYNELDLGLRAKASDITKYYNAIRTEKIIEGVKYYGLKIV